MEKVKVCIWLEPDLHQYLDEARGDELKIPQFIRLILKQKMKSAVKRKPKTETQGNDPFANPTINGRLIPDDLKDHAHLICEWWPIRHKKKATCSTKVAERIFDKLRTFTPKERKTALERAIAGGWMDIWEVKQSKIAEEPKNNHPQHRVFTADKGFID